MNANPDLAVSRIAAAIGEPARARMLYCLLDGHARTSTELAVVAEVTPSTASVHLQRLRSARLVRMAAQGKHRYYTLAGGEVARALEGLSVVAGFRAAQFTPSTPPPLRAARTCYDHIAGRLGVLLHNRFQALGWMAQRGGRYELTGSGRSAAASLGLDLADGGRRKFAYPCLDWSERQPHIGGALGAALLGLALRKRWVQRELDSRCLEITGRGRREMRDKLGIEV
jgi:DNA-binding transcriptional ArsR family regulator